MQSLRWPARAGRRAFTCLIVLVGALVAGCAESPETQSLTEVTFSLTLRDPASGDIIIGNETGLPLENFTITALAGAPSGLDAAFDARLAAASPGDVIEGTFQLADFSGEIGKEHTYGPSPAVSSIGRADFVAYIGEPEVGMVFAMPQYYNATVEAFDNETVTYRITPEPNQRDPVDAVGAILVTTVEGDNITQRLEPNVGSTFVIQPVPGAPGPLGLVAGAYRSEGANETHILYSFQPIPLPQWVGKEVLVHAAVQTVQEPAGDGAGHDHDGHTHGDDHDHGDSHSHGDDHDHGGH